MGAPPPDCSASHLQCALLQDRAHPGSCHHREGSQPRQLSGEFNGQHDIVQRKEGTTSHSWRGGGQRSRHMQWGGPQACGGHVHQAPLSMGFSRQEYWSELPCPSPGDLPNPGIQPISPALAHKKALLSPLHLGEAQPGRSDLLKAEGWVGAELGLRPGFSAP